MTSERSSPDDLIDGRYRRGRQLGRGAQGTTHLAVDVSSGRQVALKELDFASIGSWDAVAVFEREAAVLGGLTHPNIPRTVENLRVETDDAIRLFLAQEFVEGKDLRQRLEDGEAFDEPRLRRLAGDVLDILAYLHGYSPPVLHRDVKPANLIERPDGSIALVDFGAAQGAARGEAVIGTTGYMPAEQLMGRAVPSSDLYALGATLIHLATGRHPAELGHGLGLRWRDDADLSEKFSNFIDQLVAPVAEDRFPTAVAAKRVLDQDRRRIEMALADDLARSTLEQVEMMQPVRSPKGRFVVLDTGAKLEIQGPKEGDGSVMFAFIWIVAGTVAIAIGGLLLPFVILGAVAVYIVRRQQRGISYISVSSRGVELVRRWDEVISKIRLRDVTAPQVDTVNGRATLLLWKVDGSSIVLDHGSPEDLEFARRALHRALMRLRRQAQ